MPAAVPWVEKYRPRNLSAVSHQTEVVTTLQNAIDTNRLPHLLFYGPPGTGKTSVALALCKQLYSPSVLKSRVLELNASDERGISVVRNKIKHFASLSVGMSGSIAVGAGKDSDGLAHPNPPFKIIILDEADTVTSDAQAALRRVIEAHSKITRFILICNYVTRIIEPLASRCAKFRFQPIPFSSMLKRMQHIAHAEHCQFRDDDDELKVLNSILKMSGGDMRRAVTTLQSAKALSGTTNPIQVENIAEMAGKPTPKLMTTLVASLKSNSFDSMSNAAQELILEGFGAPVILRELFDVVVSDESISDTNKATICIGIAETDKLLIDGADELLQLMKVCSIVVQCLSK